MSRTPVIVVHGGAGAHALITQCGIPRDVIEQGVSQAARTAYQILTAGGTAVEAVEAAVVSMEDNPVFNAGRGSCFTEKGTVEMDASIMDGRNLATGGVTCVEDVANPVSVARAVMEKTPHVLLAGTGAREFAVKSGCKMVTKQYLVTDKASLQLTDFPEFSPASKAEFYETTESNKISGDSKDHDTVGAVSMDQEGHVAYATSTGGITAKMPGRVGDTPIVGCGGYADDVSGAVSTTGHGESFVKVTLARHVSFLMQQGLEAQEAVEKALQYCLDRVDGQGGCIAIDSLGGVGIHWNTPGMSWASIKDGSLTYGVYKEKTESKII